MGFSGKAKSSSEGWGLGLLLVFFLDDDNDEIDKKKKLSSSPSSFKSSSSSSSSRCSSSSNLLVTRAQSTISICALIVFFTLLLFTLCTFEPTTISSPPTKTDSRFPRRWLTENHKNKNKSKTPPSSSSPSFALQGMGTLFRRGTRAMNDLLVAHLMEDTKDDDLRLFLRTLHRSGLTSRTDVVFIFPSSASMVSSNFSTIIQQENESFLRLVHHYRNKNSNNSFIKMVTGFDVTQFVKSDKKEKQGGEPLWGRRTRFNYSSSSSSIPEGENEQGEFNELSWGSVVGFEVSELDPEDSLAGFLDHVPIRLRRWACYPMLLGRVRRNFKHLMLVDVKDVVVLGDPLSRVRNRSAESVFLWTTENAHGKHNRRNSEKTQSHNKKDSKSVSADAIMGGIRGVRRLSNAMLTEIVRAALQHKSKISISDSTILTQLVHNDSLLKNINIITTESPIPETSSLVSKNNPSGRRSSFVYRGNSNLGLFSSLLKEICSSPLDSSVYRDC